MDYELSIEADKDLEDIFDYTYNQFGADQAFKYVQAFDTCFSDLCKTPLMGRARTEIRQGLRSYLRESHIVFYRVIDKRIRIVRILHGSRDLPRFF